MTIKTVFLYIILCAGGYIGYQLDKYFGRFVIADFKRNKKLNRMRYFAIAYSWAFLILSIWLFCDLPNHKDWLLGILALFFSMYYTLFTTTHLEEPKQYHQPKKRKLKYKKPWL
jgi:hypothetical protein